MLILFSNVEAGSRTTWRKLEGKLNMVLQNVATANIALSELIVAACKKASD